MKVITMNSHASSEDIKKMLDEEDAAGWELFDVQIERGPLGFTFYIFKSRDIELVRAGNC